MVRDTTDLYQGAAQGYDSIIEPFARRIRLVGIRMLLNPAGKSVLDIGCGTGSQLALYRKAGCRIYGIDQSSAMISVARKKLGTDAGLYQGDGTSLPFSDAVFDFVTITLVLHETPQLTRRAIVTEAVRVVKPDGHLLFTDYHVGPVRRITGHLFHLAGRIVEAFVGGEHYHNFRIFVRNGGLPELITGSGLRIEKETRALGEAFVVYLVKRNG